MNIISVAIFSETNFVSTKKALKKQGNCITERAIILLIRIIKKNQRICKRIINKQIEGKKL